MRRPIPITICFVATILCASLPGLVSAAEEKCLGSADWLSDHSSSGCLACHDGTVASMVTNVDGGAGEMPRAEHPVGVSYLEAYLRSRRLRHPSELDPRIRLPEGKVQCSTCHSFTSSEKAMLVMPNRVSELCLACHLM